MKKPARSLALLLAACLLAASGAASGREDGDHEAARKAMARGEILPLTRILAVVAKANPGNVLEVELDRHGQRFVYEVKVLTPAGKVNEVQVDGKTGALLDDGKGDDAGADRRR
jgi:uncharacterized membrane protein YkoI